MEKRSSSASKFVLLHLFALLAATTACKKDDGTTSANLTQEMIGNTEAIAAEAALLAEQHLSQAISSNTLVDPQAIADELEDMPEVERAWPSSSGTSIIIQKADGHMDNIVLVPWDDERWYSETEYSPALAKGAEVLDEQPTNYPTGTQALILAPFFNDFLDKVDILETQLKAMGYQVTTFKNQEANLSKFKGDYLQQFSVIFISTHGLGNARTIGNKSSTLLATGEVVSIKPSVSLTPAELNALASMSIKGTSYFGVSVPWLELTKGGEFPNSWFYASACESSMVEFGDSSLMAFVLNNGAGGFTGYDQSIYNPVALSVTKQIMPYVSKGQALKEATANIKSDRIFRAFVYFIRKAGNPMANIDLLESYTSSNEPFYIVKPNPFPYNHARFEFFSRASYNSSKTGDYDFAFSRGVEVDGKLENGWFKGTYTGYNGDEEISHTLEFEIDTINHTITQFKVFGSSIIDTDNNSYWEINSSSTDFPLNEINRFGSVNGEGVADYLTPVTYTYIYMDNGTKVTETLKSLNFDGDSKLEIEFTQLEE